MIKLFLFLFLFLLKQNDTIISKFGDSSLEKKIYKSKYATDEMPEELHFHYTNPDSVIEKFKNPFHAADLSDSALKLPEIEQPVDNTTGYLESEINKPASIGTQTATRYFNWDSTHAERFVHSPCYTTLGFDPNKDMILQENQYQDCEAGYRNNNLEKILICVGVVLGFGSLVYLGITKRVS